MYKIFNYIKNMEYKKINNKRNYKNPAQSFFINILEYKKKLQNTKNLKNKRKYTEQIKYKIHKKIQNTNTKKVIKSQNKLFINITEH